MRFKAVFALKNVCFVIKEEKYTIFFKKNMEIFGAKGFLPYLCIRFRETTNAQAKRECEELMKEADKRCLNIS